MRRPCDGLWVVGDGIDDRIEDRVDDRVCEGLGVIFAIEESAFRLWRRDRGRVAHVEFEGFVNVELDRLHGHVRNRYPEEEGGSDENAKARVAMQTRQYNKDRGRGGKMGIEKRGRAGW